MLKSINDQLITFEFDNCIDPYEASLIDIRS